MKSSPSQITSIYDIPVTSITGESLDLSEYRGKYLLIVNVASKCGFTKQYKALQELSKAYEDEVVVIGFPCNQFGAQEPGTLSEISAFCEMRYGVTFPLTEKIHVKGSKQHPVYQWLTRKELNGRKKSTVHWNFQKYLIDQDGHLVDVFYSTTSPLSKKITRYLHKA